ncbi:hypothetical protein BV22DRAFT_118103 [Leucogyrophana mollusca]|uniref:Uncharacterized protein n=1 Tax=Leucogyrophana mollusca TaxID=85980 RepID=A0ACB8BX21_9AGAM|nr:hypothetical protein BV22DRAFT_118103 [Leucogyrophana mollusca]
MINRNELNFMNVPALALGVGLPGTSVNAIEAFKKPLSNVQLKRTAESQAPEERALKTARMGLSNDELRRTPEYLAELAKRPELIAAQNHLELLKAQLETALGNIAQGGRKDSLKKRADEHAESELWNERLAEYKREQFLWTGRMGKLRQKVRVMYNFPNPNVASKKAASSKNKASSSTISTSSAVSSSSSASTDISSLSTIASSASSHAITSQTSEERYKKLKDLQGPSRLLEAAATYLSEDDDGVLESQGNRELLLGDFFEEAEMEQLPESKLTEKEQQYVKELGVEDIDAGLMRAAFTRMLMGLDTTIRSRCEHCAKDKTVPAEMVDREYTPALMGRHCASYHKFGAQMLRYYENGDPHTPNTQHTCLLCREKGTITHAMKRENGRISTSFYRHVRQFHGDDKRVQAWLNQQSVNIPTIIVPSSRRFTPSKAFYTTHINEDVSFAPNNGTMEELEVGDISVHPSGRNARHRRIRLALE